MYVVCTHLNRLVDAILISILNVPLFSEERKKKTYINPIRLVTVL